MHYVTTRAGQASKEIVSWIREHGYRAMRPKIEELIESVKASR